MTEAKINKKRGPKPKPDDEVKRKMLTVRIRGDLRAKLAARSAETEMSRSEVIELAIRQYFDQPAFVESVRAMLREELRPAPKMCDCGLYAGDACSDVRHCGTIS